MSMFNTQYLYELFTNLQINFTSTIVKLINAQFRLSAELFLPRIISYLQSIKFVIDLDSDSNFSTIIFNRIKKIKKSVISTELSDVFDQVVTVLRTGIYLQYDKNQTYRLATLIYCIGTDNFGATSVFLPGFQKINNELLEKERKLNAQLKNYPIGLPIEYFDDWDHLSALSWGNGAKANIRIICREANKKGITISEDHWNDMLYKDNKCYLRICEEYELPTRGIKI